MSLRVRPTFTIRPIDQENPTSTIPLKATATVVPEKPIIKRGVLGDLGNTLHNAIDQPKGKVLGSSQVPAKETVKITKETTAIAINQPKDLKTKDQENVEKKDCKVGKAIQLRTKKVSATNVSSQSRFEIYDPDEGSKNDPLMVTEYVEDIMAYLRSIETDFPIDEKILEGTKITSKMRSILVDWLVRVHEKFSLSLETLYLCVSIVDRYLQVNKSVTSSVYQLVGATALLLAAKHEETFLQNLEDFVYVCEDAFTPRQFLQMEINILKKLDFKMSWPLSITFLRRYSKIGALKAIQHDLAKYILELALLEYSLAHVKPSIQAAAACCLAIAIFKDVLDPCRVWTPTLTHYTTYRYMDFKKVVHEFAHIIDKAKTSKFDSVREKYSKSKFAKISLNSKLQGPVVRRLLVLRTLTKK